MAARNTGRGRQRLSQIPLLVTLLNELVVAERAPLTMHVHQTAAFTFQEKCHVALI